MVSIACRVSEFMGAFMDNFLGERVSVLCCVYGHFGPRKNNHFPAISQSVVSSLHESKGVAGLADAMIPSHPYLSK
jgi:hypothetical protein